MKNWLKEAPLLEKVATLVLIFVSLFYCVFLILSLKFPQSIIVKLLKIAFSASLVGAIADTYAVFGLFHDLGPHTNVLKKRRKELTDKTVEFVGDFLLSKEELLKEIENLDVQSLLKHLDGEEQREVLKQVLISLFEKRLKEKDFGVFSSLLSFVNAPLSQLIAKEVTKLVDGLFEEVKTNPEIKEVLSNHIKKILAELLYENHDKVKESVKKKLESLSDEEFLKALKSVSWKELQWIRINGTVLGFVVGLVLGVLEILVFKFVR